MFIGPFFQWLFIPLLSINTFGAIIGGIYLAFVLNGGVGVVETYVERASLVNKFRIRTFAFRRFDCWRCCGIRRRNYLYAKS